MNEQPMKRDRKVPKPLIDHLVKVRRIVEHIREIMFRTRAQTNDTFTKDLMTAMVDAADQVIGHLQVDQLKKEAQPPPQRPRKKKP